MAVTQESRYRMHQRLDEVLGAEPAATLMEHLPPTGWADLATKHDVAHGTELLSQRIDAVDERLTGNIQALDQKFMSALAVETSSLHKAIAESRGDMFKFMIMQVVAFFAANVGLLGLMATLVRGG